MDARRQRAALKLAADNGWTVRQLRDYVAVNGEPQAALDVEPEPMTDREQVDVAKRLEQIGQELDAYQAEIDGKADDDGDRSMPPLDEFVPFVDVQWLYQLARRLTRSGR